MENADERSEANNLNVRVNEEWMRILLLREKDLKMTDLDEPADKEPDYINLRQDAELSEGNNKVFRNVYGEQENIYEEINDLQRKLALCSVAVATAEPQQNETPPEIFHRKSLVEEVLDEVERVRQHLQTNLEPEQTVTSPESNLEEDVTDTLQLRKTGNHKRSNSAVSSSTSTAVDPLSLSRWESLIDLGRKTSVSRASSSSISSSSRSDSRRSSIRNIHQNLRMGIQGFHDWTERCGNIFAKKSKKRINIANQDRKSTCEAGPGPPGAGEVLENGTDEGDGQIYEDIDRASLSSSSAAANEAVRAETDASAAGDAETLDVTASRGSETPGVGRISSDDSWGSGEFESFSSDSDVEEESEKTQSTARSATLRALLTAKSIRNKWLESRNQKKSAPESTATTSPPAPERKFTRLFSLRRSSTSISIDTSSQNGVAQVMGGTSAASGTTPDQTRLPQLLEEEEIMANLGLGSGNSTVGTLYQRRHQPPMLPPMPANLSPEQVKRRYIVSTIIHSENSYVASLQRLVNEYKKLLEESHPPILNSTKISTLFHRLPEILQCHTLFRVALAECVRSWDREEKIGDVFVASFSKAEVLYYYSDFINNFTRAMDVARQESKRKSAFADFLQVRQLSSPDRLSFFGLLVKPVQRFPQFILLLQDLLKHTPQGHHDRMSLQLALTQLESLAEMLNERKREAEQYQAFRDTLRRVSGKFSLRPLADNNRCLLRQDDVTLVDFNQSGLISKTKDRRLLLLNDLLVCVTVSQKDTNEFRRSERLSLKWAFPITDVEVEDTSGSPTLSRLLSAGSNLRCSEVISGVDNLCQEMNQLMHDYEVITRIAALINTLHGNHEGLDGNTVKEALCRIQRLIQQKDEEMAWIDACCLQLIVRSKSGKEEKFTFQMESPEMRKDWVIELRLAQLALDPKNSPSWYVPEQERRPSTKMPLFVKATPVSKSVHATEVRCGCFYTLPVQKSPLSVRLSGPRFLNYLLIVTVDGVSSHVTVYTTQEPIGPSLKEAASFSILEVRVTCVEYSPGYRPDSNGDEDPAAKSKLSGNLIWLGTESRRILVYPAQDPEKHGQLASLNVPASIVQMRYHLDQMFVSLSNGAVAIVHRDPTGNWDLRAPATLITLGTEPVICLLPIGMSLYAACGRGVFVLDGMTGDILRNFVVQHESNFPIQAMAHSGIGLWISLRQTSTICLYHTETFRHLQDISVASNVTRILGNAQVNIHVTALMASKGLLWVGTNVGIALTIPLPRLEGVPIISGRANVSYHAHCGPITFFLSLQAKNKSPVVAPPACVTPPTSPSQSCTIQEESENESASPPASNQSQEKMASMNGHCKSTSYGNSPHCNTVPKAYKPGSSESPVVLRRRIRESFSSKRLSRTLPRGQVALSFTECDIFGLYGDLLNLKDYEDVDGTGAVTDVMYETLRRSDPDLATIPGKVSTLDRRLHMKAARPRSLDLSNWSVDSRSSMHTTSSGSEDSSSVNPSVLSPNSSTLKSSTTRRTSQRNNDTLKPADMPRTIFTIMGGRGYLHMKSTEAERKNSPASFMANTNDAHFVLWEMKL